MSACDPELCWAEHRRLDGCDVIVCQDHDDIPTVNVSAEGGEWLHPRGVCADCDSCWVDVDANRAYDQELVPCPDCEGHGEIGTHQNYWGQWDTRQCATCKGECEIRRVDLPVASS